MANLDFTVIPSHIKQTLKKAGHELTDDQFMLISGSLAAVQLMIQQIGLDGTIDVLEPTSKDGKL